MQGKHRTGRFISLAGLHGARIHMSRVLWEHRSNKSGGSPVSPEIPELTETLKPPKLPTLLPLPRTKFPLAGLHPTDGLSIVHRHGHPHGPIIDQASSPVHGKRKLRLEMVIGRPINFTSLLPQLTAPALQGGRRMVSYPISS